MTSGINSKQDLNLSLLMSSNYIHPKKMVVDRLRAMHHEGREEFFLSLPGSIATLSKGVRNCCFGRRWSQARK
jgi:hypothetical protein